MESRVLNSTILTQLYPNAIPWGDKKAACADKKAACAEVGLNYKTTRPYGDVARLIDSESRNSLLGFSHHKALASSALTPDQRRQLLDLAQHGDGCIMTRLPFCSPIRYDGFNFIINTDPYMDINTRLSALTHKVRAQLHALSHGATAQREQLQAAQSTLEIELETLYQSTLEIELETLYSRVSNRVAQIEEQLTAFEIAIDSVPNSDNARDSAMKLLASVRRLTAAGHNSKTALLHYRIDEKQAAPHEIALFCATVARLTADLEALTAICDCQSEANIILQDINTISLPSNMQELI